MRVDATYDNGKIVLHRPLRFAHQRFQVKVEVPEGELVDMLPPIHSKPNIEKSQSQELQEVLSHLYSEAMTLSDVAKDQVSEKQQARWDAAQLRSAQKDEGLSHES